MNMHSQYPVPFDEGELRDVLGRFATGVAVVTTCGVDAVPVGLTVNSFASVSLAPPEVLWSINSGAPSRSAFEQHGAFAVNVMPEDDQERVLQFARPNSDRFAGVPWRRGWRDVPIDSAHVGPGEGRIIEYGRVFHSSVQQHLGQDIPADAQGLCRAVEV